MAKASINQLAQAVLKRGMAQPQSVAGYLIAEHRTRDLAAVMREVSRIRSERGIVEAEVTSAFPVADSTKKTIRRLLHQQLPSAKQIILNLRRDPEVVGGVRVATDNLLLDLTAQGRLKMLKQLKMERN